VAFASIHNLEHHLGMMEKQVRMLAEMAITAPVVVRPEGTSAIVPQRRMADLIDRLEQEVRVMRLGLRQRVV
jgi:hypothetical protein